MTASQPTKPIATLVLLGCLCVAAVIAAPLVAEFALHHGEPGWQGWLYPVMTTGLVIASSAVIAVERIAARRPPWFAWLVLVSSAVVTGLMAAGQVIGP